MKITKKRYLTVTIVAVLGMITAVSVAFANIDTSNAIPRPLGVDPALYNDNPAPLLKANKQIAKAALIPEEKILDVFSDPSTESNHLSASNSKTAMLTTWGEFEKSKGTDSFTQVAKDRQVWVLNGSFSEYQDVRLGKVKNAQVTLVFDAETGDRIYKRIVGDPEKGLEE